MVIDIYSDIPIRQTIPYQIKSMGLLEGYFQTFKKGFGRLAGLSESDFDDLAKQLSNDELIETLIQRALQRSKPLSEYVPDFINTNVQHMCLFNDDPNILVEMQKMTSNMVFGFIEINPRESNAVNKIRESILGMGLHGVALIPFKHQVYPDDLIFEPIYKECEKLGVPIWIHSSNNWWNKVTIDYGRPVHLDNVACSYPNLKIIAGHGGWPWVNEMVVVAWRHKNVYIDTSGHRPKYIGVAGSGWEMLMHFGNRVIQDKIVFGSGWTLLGMPLSRVVEEIENLPLHDKVKEKWLYKNSEILLNL